MLKPLMQKTLVGLRIKSFTFLILSLLKLNFSTTVFGATFLCTTVFRADTGNKKTANFTYSYLYARPVKELLIRKHVRAKQPKFSGALS